MSFDDFLIAFRELFPEFASISDIILNIYYEQGLSVFGSCKYAFLFLVAHLISIDQANQISVVGNGTGATIDGGSGENTQEKVGEISVSLFQMAEKGAETYYTQTAYGRRYLSFKKACPTYAFSARVAKG